jgi:hypothetical protein
LEIKLFLGQQKQIYFQLLNGKLEIKFANPCDIKESQVWFPLSFESILEVESKALWSMYWRTPTPCKGELARDENGEGRTT